ncbi:response regulator [Maribacter confluentis]|uniref:Response regulator n=1 Tax=Maribacter confluentis TaxID=1656093 RepID=A0ABT8RT92_9FLAO|nr:response regulator [Maribacter confluentis]MDO1514151.1 response regulator [Maribacter confluentis]
MKILAIDNDTHVLLFLERHLSLLGYEVITTHEGEEGIALFHKENPDLILVDINMPGLFGLNVLRHIRFVHNSKTPVIIMLEESYEQIASANLGPGVDYFMKKPFGLDDISKKIAQVLDINTCSINNAPNEQMYRNDQVGIVVPCQDVEDELLSTTFINMPFQDLGYHICFVNQGSADQTQPILDSLQDKYSGIIKVCQGHNLDNDEAISLGVEHLLQDQSTRYVGFLNAQITSDFTDYKDLVKIVKNSDFKIVNGARIARMDRKVSKQTARKIISSTVHIIMQTILNIPFMAHKGQEGEVNYS